MNTVGQYLGNLCFQEVFDEVAVDLLGGARRRFQVLL